MNTNWPTSTFLGRLQVDTREEILKTGTSVRYPIQRPLLRQGDESQPVILLVEGVVKVVTSSEIGYEMLTAVRIAGELVGEMAAFEDLPRSSSVIACSDVRARVIQRDALEEFLIRRPDAMRELFRMISARLRWANQRRLDFQAYDAPTRLARVLVELSQAYGLPVTGEPGQRTVLALSLTQSELASLAGLKLATAERALSRLYQLGLIERNYRKITISDAPKLLSFAKIVGQNPY